MAATRRTRSKRAERREELRAVLMAVIEQLLAQGEELSEISVDRLAGEASISRSTFYIYFEDKTDLLHTSFEHVMGELDTATMRWWALDPARVTPVELRQTLGAVLRTYHPYAHSMAAVFDAAAQDPWLQSEVDAFMERGIAGLRRHIVGGQGGGLVDADLQPDETARWLFWMAERGQHQMTRHAAPDELEALIDTYTAIVWRTLYEFAPRAAARTAG